jgi:lipopolysaccharide transport system permease protein
MTFFGFDRRDSVTVWNFFMMFLRDKFLGSRLGGIWAVLNPLLILAIYTYVFGFVFNSRLPGSNSKVAYAVWLFAGYGPWLAISESLNTAASTVIGNAGLVKNMAFKTECLPVAASMMGLVPLAVSIVVVVVLMFVDGQVPSWHALMVIPAVLMMFAFSAAVGVGFSLLTIFVRDFSVILPTLLMAALFASPVMYPMSSVPAALQAAAKWNPLYLLADAVRRPLVYHELFPLESWIYMVVLITVIALFNLRVFRKLKGDFVSVL